MSAPLAWPAAIVAAALLAHGGCLGSVFYLDDWGQVVQCDAVDQGQWYTWRPRALTYLTYFLTYRACGMSPVAFHAGNLLLHALVSLVLYGFARDFLAAAVRWPAGQARRVGGWAALLFAVHPLCSEMPNYTRARDIGMVSLLSLLAAWAALRWRGGGGWRAGAGVVVAVAAAAFSKEVGLPLAVGTAALATLGVARPAQGADPGRRRRAFLWLAGGIVLLAGAGLASGLYPRLFGAGLQSWRDARLGWHVLTEARVFWMYLARVAWPAGLCSDHQIAWTISAHDPAAWWSLAGEAALALTSVVLLCQRRRPAACAAGALAAMAGLDIAHRLANVSGELMVEYRMYPAMGPLCVGLAWGLDAALRRPGWPPAIARSVLGVLMAAGIVVSARRTLDWHSLDALVADIVAQYPDNARAWQELQEADLRAGRWQAVGERQEDIRRACDRAAADNAAWSARRYADSHLVLIRISSEGNAAVALARSGRRAEAFARLTWIHTVMDNAHFTEPFYWGAYYYASALVHDAVGQRADALDDLRLSNELYAGNFPFFVRQLRRYEHGEPLL